MTVKSSHTERVAAYVDGYNVYHGLRHKAWERFYWLDFRQLFERELRDTQQLVAVNYFTALGRKQSPEAAKRQETYLAALRASGGVEVRIAGKWEKRPWQCPKCSRWIKRPQEKMTDVALAVRFVADAHSDVYDTAWLMCADADLIPAVQYVHETFPEKLIVAVSPRGRRSDHLIDAVGPKREIGRSRYARAQLPDEITGPDGITHRRPDEWR